MQQVVVVNCTLCLTVDTRRDSINSILFGAGGARGGGTPGLACIQYRVYESTCGVSRCWQLVRVVYMHNNLVSRIFYLNGNIVKNQSRYVSCTRRVCMIV